MEVPASKLMILCCVLSSGLIDAVTGFMGPGLYSLVNSRACADPEQYPNKMEVTRKKFTRTQDSVNLHLLFEETVTEDNDVRMEFCQHVDGGCKHTMTLDGKFCAFSREYFGQNWINVLEGIGMDPPDCPVPKGDYTASDIILDYEELPQNSIYGRFDAVLYTTSDGVDKSCITFTIEFK